MKKRFGKRFAAMLISLLTLIMALSLIHIFAQHTVSVAIRELEEHYGICLFERLNKRLRITEEGKRLLGYARHIIGPVSYTHLFRDRPQGGRLQGRASRGQCDPSGEDVYKRQVYGGKTPGMGDDPPGGGPLAGADEDVF